jgi:hypothetical protein
MSAYIGVDSQSSALTEILHFVDGRPESVEKIELLQE